MSAARPHRPTMHCAIAAIAVIASTAAAPAQDRQYDDPAIAICELTVRFDLMEGADYRRTRAAIQGTTVVVDYETSVLNTAPIAASRTCDFEIAKDGRFNLRLHKPANKDCIPQMVALQRAEGNRSVFTSSDIERARDAYSQCVAGMKEDLRKMSAEVLDREPRLLATGIYPIPSNRTQLAR